MSRHSTEEEVQPVQVHDGAHRHINPPAMYHSKFGVLNATTQTFATQTELRCCAISQTGCGTPANVASGGGKESQS